MPTGYEVGMYRDIGIIAATLRSIDMSLQSLVAIVEDERLKESDDVVTESDK